MSSPSALSTPTLPAHDREVILFQQGMTLTLPLPPQPPRGLYPLFHLGAWIGALTKSHLLQTKPCISQDMGPPGKPVIHS